jgi:hypothetical protein
MQTYYLLYHNLCSFGAFGERTTATEYVAQCEKDLGTGGI